MTDHKPRPNHTWIQKSLRAYECNEQIEKERKSTAIRENVTLKNIRQEEEKSKQVECFKCGHYTTKMELMADDSSWQRTPDGWACGKCLGDDGSPQTSGETDA